MWPAAFSSNYFTAIFLIRNIQASNCIFLSSSNYDKEGEREDVEGDEM